MQGRLRRRRSSPTQPVFSFKPQPSALLGSLIGLMKTKGRETGRLDLSCVIEDQACGKGLRQRQLAEHHPVDRAAGLRRRLLKERNGRRSFCLPSRNPHRAERSAKAKRLSGSEI